MTIKLLPTAPDRPAASANGTVNPSDMPMTISRTTALPVKCVSTCVVRGYIRPSQVLLFGAEHLSSTTYPCHLLRHHAQARGGRHAESPPRGRPTASRSGERASPASFLGAAPRVQR